MNLKGKRNRPNCEKRKKFAESEKVRVKTYNRFGEVNDIGTIEQVVYKTKGGRKKMKWTTT